MQDAQVTDVFDPKKFCCDIEVILIEANAKPSLTSATKNQRSRSFFKNFKRSRSR
jgi:hypothetical protein